MPPRAGIEDFFGFPVGVLLFNRPHLAKFVLQCLKASNLPIQEEKLVFHLDGYLGSKFEETSEKNKTKIVEQMIRNYFPKAHILKQEKNIGIAQSFFVLQEYIFENFDCEFAVFQEEDTFLYPHYFQILADILQMANGYLWIGAISINDIDHYQNNESDFVVPTFGTREFALRRNVFLQGKEVHQAYLDALGDSYRTKNIEIVNRALEKYGMQLKSPMQDVFQHERILGQERLHLRVNLPGSFQANFSEGESIPGLSILGLCKELLRKNEMYCHTSPGDLAKLLPLSFDRQSLDEKETFLWNTWWTNRTISSRQENEVNRLIRIRNATGLSQLKFLLERLLINKNIEKIKYVNI